MMDQLPLFEVLPGLPRIEKLNYTMTADWFLTRYRPTCFVFRFDLHPKSEHGSMSLSGELILNHLQAHDFKPPHNSALNEMLSGMQRVPAGLRIFLIEKDSLLEPQKFVERVDGNLRIGTTLVLPGYLNQDTDRFLAIKRF